jgi:glycosyltransferase involved in cell wall biosynthesis
MAIKEINKIVKNGYYDIVHCHTPIASMCVRIACRKIKKRGTRVIYTAHGFHFYKGAPLKNWFIFSSVERLCAKWTDTLITINKEDYAWAKKHLKVNLIEYIPGVGIDVDKFVNINVDKTQKRKTLGIPEDAFLLLSVGELNENKNHQVVIKALAELSNLKIHYAIAGKGDKSEELEEMATKFAVNLHLLGYRNDVAELYKTADVYILPSIREGLNVSIMEAMASSCPIICSNIRGNVDMVDNNGGYLCNAKKVGDFVSSILSLYRDKEIISVMGDYNKQKAYLYDEKTINQKMLTIYYGKD